jgi:hypothetical protein
MLDGTLGGVRYPGPRGSHIASYVCPSQIYSELEMRFGRRRREEKIAEHERRSLSQVVEMILEKSV